MIRNYHRNNTRGHRSLARQKWQACRQLPKQSLDQYINAYSRACNDLLQTRVAHDSEAELSQFQAGLDRKRHSTDGLAALEFQDLSAFGIPSAYTRENVISHLCLHDGRQEQSNMVHNHE